MLRVVVNDGILVKRIFTVNRIKECVLTYKMIPKHSLVLKNNISCEIPEFCFDKSKCIGLFGASGSGKTSLLTHFYKLLLSMDYNVAYGRQDIILPSFMTVSEVLVFYRGLSGFSEISIDDIASALRIDHILHVEIGSFVLQGVSGGEKKRILLAAILLLSPGVDVLLLDEPFSGLDEADADRCLSFVAEMVKKYKLSAIASCHILPLDVISSFDEIWDITESQVRMFPKENRNTPIIYKKHQHHSVLREIYWLCWREWISLKRHPIKFVEKMVISCLTVFLQAFLLYPSDSILDRYLATKSMFDLFQFIVNYQVVLFTTCILPMGFITDTIKDRELVVHEDSQGFYRMRHYTITRILLDCTLLFFCSFIMALIVLPPRLSFMLTLVMAFTIFMVMTFTHLLICVSIFTFRCHYTSVLLLTSCYISLSYILNLGFLLHFKNSFFKFIQYLSMFHIQTNVFFSSFLSFFPDNPMVEKVLDLTNLSDIFGHDPLSWILYGLAYTTACVLVMLW